MCVCVCVVWSLVIISICTQKSAEPSAWLITPIV